MKGHIITGIILLLLLKVGTTNVGRNGAKGAIYNTGKKIVNILGQQTFKVGESAVEKRAKVTFKTSFKKQITKSFKNNKLSLSKIVPYGNGGINIEKRTLGEICKHPVSNKLIKELDNMGLSPQSLSKIKADLSKMGSNTIPTPAENGNVDFSSISWPGITPQLPDKKKLIEEISKNRKITDVADIRPDDIRKISYDIAQNALAEKYGLTKEQASLIIGKLDLVIHEAESGVVQIVPNNVHRFKQLYAHKGYVSKMMKEINGKIVND
jgi:hypothetical protein